MRIAETTASSPTANFLWDMVNGGSLPQLVDDGTNAYIYGPLSPGGTAPVEQINTANNSVSFLSSAPTGVEAVFTSGGTLQEQAAYNTYGMQVALKTSAALSCMGVQGTSCFGFQGSYVDRATGFSYLINRYYDPFTDQFLSVDPAVTQTGQPYAFDWSDPLDFVDPTGLGGFGAGIGSHTHWCNSLGNKIGSARNKAAKRHNDLAKDVKNLKVTNPQSWDNHVQALEQMQNRLNNLLDQWDKSDCGNSGSNGIPADAKSVARVPVPTTATALIPGYAAPSNTGLPSGIIGASRIAGIVGGLGVAAWWLGKLASPLCGPALPACAVAG